MIPLMFPRVPQSSLGILRVRQLPPPLEHPSLKNPTICSTSASNKAKSVHRHPPQRCNTVLVVIYQHGLCIFTVLVSVHIPYTCFKYVVPGIDTLLGKKKLIYLDLLLLENLPKHITQMVVLLRDESHGRSSKTSPKRHIQVYKHPFFREYNIQSPFENVFMEPKDYVFRR